MTAGRDFYREVWKPPLRKWHGGIAREWRYVDLELFVVCLESVAPFSRQRRGQFLYKITDSSMKIDYVICFDFFPERKLDPQEL